MRKLLLLCVLFSFPASSFANNVTVGCTGAPGGGYDFTTLGAALGFLHSIPNVNHIITVSGTCAENLYMDNFENIDIGGAGNAVLTEIPSRNILFIANSRNIKIRNLIFRGRKTASASAVIFNDSTGTIENCTIEQSNNGVQATGIARVTIINSIIQDNMNNGVFAGDNAVVVIGRNLPAESITIQGNANGISAGGSSMVNIGGSITIQGNVICGVTAVGGNVSFGGLGPILITDNLRGMAVMAGHISQNSSNFVVRNNTDIGISAFEGGVVSLKGSIIENNGSLNSAFPGPANMIINVGASALLQNVTIRNSPVTGLIVRENSVALVIGTTITGNQGDGVQVDTLSGIRFQNSMSTITGNEKRDLVCDPMTYAIGSGLATIGKVQCPTLRK